MADQPLPVALADLAGRMLVDAEQRLPLRSTLAGLARAATGLLEVEGAAVWLPNGESPQLLTATTPELESLERLQAGDGPLRRALAERRPVAVEDLTAVPTSAWAAAAAAAGWRSTLAVPVVGRGRTWAVLTLARRVPGPLRPGDRQVALALADVAAAVAVLSEDRDAAVRAQEALAHQALHDNLTGLANRTLLLDRLRHELLASTRRRTPLAVLFVDLDGFKQVNDELGHAAGDELLVLVARRLTSVLRAQDTVARLGGDEFVAICADLPADLVDDLLDRHVTALAGRLQRAVATPPYLLGAGQVQVSASVGSAVAVPGETTAESLLRDADTAMYRAKRARLAPTTIDLRERPAPREA